ncbi:anti-sigma regulatory factor [Streptomyces minutiscleroticus]|uniref:Anti-sigma regulatory factor n=1 Tax=Streptomyces minutiscleroticus TaxID=68238 RepID=A0A918KV14_9ACTN|nr:sensor histidine kinase [Streptomyces minutiscleroticus]GGX75393.1 anti-sigma regulatory factor [Streptomyces minutiscleroticus]
MTRTGFVHQALCFGSDAEFLDGARPFVDDGLAAGDAVLAVVRPGTARLLREALGGRAREVEFADAGDWYGAPSRTLGQYHAYCGRHGTDAVGAPRRVRIVGEPVWEGRTAFETGEWTRYESLLNVAFADSGHWILCPYDARTTPEGVMRTAGRTHPELVAGPRTPAAGTEYTDPAEFAAECDLSWPAGLPGGGEDLSFSHGRTSAVRRVLTTYAGQLGLSGRRTQDMVAAVHEAVSNALRFGGGQGVLRLRDDDTYVVCEIADAGTASAAGTAPFPGHLPPGVRDVSGHGMWVARQLSDLATERLGPTGSVVRLYFRRDPAASGGDGPERDGRADRAGGTAAGRPAGSGDRFDPGDPGVPAGPGSRADRADQDGGGDQGAALLDR